MASDTNDGWIIGAPPEGADVEWVLIDENGPTVRRAGEYSVETGSGAFRGEVVASKEIGDQVDCYRIYAYRLGTPRPEAPELPDTE